MPRPSGASGFSFLAATFCLGILVFAWVPSPAPAQDAASRARAVRPTADARRDSLRAEIQRYAEVIQALRDSVTAFDATGAAREEQLAEVEAAIASLSAAIGDITSQLSQMQVEVEEGRVSLRDGRGGQVVLDLPPDLGERLSEGLSSISKVVLDELPDTVRIGEDRSGFTWSWGDKGLNIVPVAPPAPQRVLEGGIVKFRDDLEVAADEVVLGDVVVIMGDALVAGHVQGDLVVVLGDAQLADTAVVDGETVTVLGRLDRSNAARLGSVTVVNPGSAYIPRGLGTGRSDWLGFWGWQAFFVLVVLLVLLMLAFLPRPRLETVLQTLTRRGGESLGLGLVVALVGHLVLLALGAILVLTVIGIPVALLVLLGVALLDLAAVGVAAMVAGRRICGFLGLGCDRPWREAILGLLALHLPALLAALFGAAGLPVAVAILFAWFGRLVKFIAFCFGLGALVLSRFGTRQTPSTMSSVAQLETSHS